MPSSWFRRVRSDGSTFLSFGGTEMDELLDHVTNSEAAEAVRANRRRVAALMNRGVRILCPETIELAEDVELDRIHPSAVIHAGARIAGKRTAIGAGAEIGREGPVRLNDSVIGANVFLDGGTFERATLLRHAGARSWAHFREGTLLEEYASVAHCVGLKQTILFPYVTLGSLINFCDCLMAGGRGSRDHSEVGSGYIHFNFSPRGDKATPSLFGDVARGVFVDQSRIFLGGLAASVGPIQVGYGSFLGPGSVYRRDVRDGRFQLSERPIRMQLDFDPEIQSGVRAKFKRNMRYIGELVALWNWYRHARRLICSGERGIEIEAGREAIEWGIDERIRQFERFVGLLPRSIDRLRETGGSPRLIDEQRRMVERWEDIEDALSGWPSITGDESERDRFLKGVGSWVSTGYLETLSVLPEDVRERGRRWLSSLVHGVEKLAETRWAPPA